jgi:hypothetical protein
MYWEVGNKSLTSRRSPLTSDVVCGPGRISVLVFEIAVQLKSVALCRRHVSHYFIMRGPSVDDNLETEFELVGSAHLTVDMLGGYQTGQQGCQSVQQHL